MQLKQAAVFGMFPQATHFETFCQLLAKLGFKGVEIWDPPDVQTLEQGAKVATAAGVPLISMMGARGLNDCAKHEQIEVALRDRIQLAARLHVRNLTIVPGPRLQGQTKEEAIENTAVLLSKVAVMAQEFRVSLNIENLNTRYDDWDAALEYVSETVRVCELVNNPSVRLLLDVYHAQVMEGDIIRKIDKYVEFIGHVQVAGSPGRHEPDSNQELNYQAICAALIRAGYRGYLSHEYSPSPNLGLEESLRRSFSACAVDVETPEVVVAAAGEVSAAKKQFTESKGRALMLVGTRQIEWVEYVDAPLRPAEIRVKSQYSAAKQGTESQLVMGHSSSRGEYDSRLGLFQAAAKGDAYPVPLGNMFVGVVVEVGESVRSLSVGDRVAGYGGFRTTHVLPEFAVQKIPPEAPWQLIVCLDPLVVAFGCVRDSHVRLGDSVAVFGMGAVGLIALQLLRRSGATQIICVSSIQERANLATALGADVVLNARECDVGHVIKELTGGRGVDAVIDFNGSATALQQALRSVGRGGNVVIGSYPPPFSLGLDFGAEAHINCPNIIFSRSESEPNRDYPRWGYGRIMETSVGLLLSGQISTEGIVQPVVPFDSLREIYPRIQDEPGVYIKLGVDHIGAAPGV